MSAYKIFTLVLFFFGFSLTAFAVKPQSISISYMSWNEGLDIDNGIKSDKSTVNYFGNSLQYANTNWLRRLDSLVDLGLGYGTAIAGTKQPSLNYQASNLKWLSLMAAFEKKIKVSEEIFFSIGPQFFYRSVNLNPNDSPLRVEAGPALNFAAVLETHLQLNESLEITQSLSALLPRPASLWSLGIAYLF